MEIEQKQTHLPLATVAQPTVDYVPVTMPKSKGRPPGSVNKFTAKARDTLETVFERMGGVDGLLEWARKTDKNTEKFYAMYFRSALQNDKRHLPNIMGKNIQVIVGDSKQPDSVPQQLTEDNSCGQ